jgi:hypothetical protein
MKNILLSFIICSLIASTSFAESESDYIEVAKRKDNSTVTSIKKKADYVSNYVTIRSYKSKYSTCIKEIQQVKKILLKELKKHPELLISNEKITDTIFPYSNKEPKPVEKFQIMIKLNNKNDIYSASEYIKNVCDNIKVPLKSKINVGVSTLGIANPEQYRKNILEKIHKYVSLLKSTMQTSKKVSITGLEKPITVKQIDNRYVELFINYTMTIEL